MIVAQASFDPAKNALLPRLLAPDELVSGKASSLRTPLSDPRIRAALLVTLVAEVAQGIFVLLFILFVAHRLHGGASEIGLLRGVQAVGAICGGLVLSMRVRTRSPGALIAGAALAFGTVDLMIWNGSGLTTATATGVYVALFIIAGAPGVVLDTGVISLLQLAPRRSGPRPQ